MQNPSSCSTRNVWLRFLAVLGGALLLGAGIQHLVAQVHLSLR
jgi:hypothetical protein